jgi:C1A family cysteine protease
MSPGSYTTETATEVQKLPILQGWQPDDYDADDRPYRPLQPGSLKAQVNFAQQEKQKSWLTEVYYQGRGNTCVANACAAAYRFLANKVAAEDSNGKQLQLDPSRRFIYYNARAIPILETQGNVVTEKFKDQGCKNRNAFKAISKFGVCSETACVYDLRGQYTTFENIPNLDVRPLPTAYREAKANRFIEYCRLDPDHPNIIENQMTPAEREAVGLVTLVRLKQCLSEGYPVVFGFNFYWNDKKIPWIKSTEDYWTLPDVPQDRRNKGPENKKFGHTVLAIGYDQETERVLCQNSFGLPEEDNPWQSKDGLFWIKYHWILDWEATDDFWMCRAIKVPKIDPPQFPSAVSPGFHKLANTDDWDGKPKLWDDTSEDFITPRLAQLSSTLAQKISCIFTNDTRYLLIHDAKPLCNDSSAALVYSRIIRPYNESVQLGAYSTSDSSTLDVFFRLSVWEVAANAPLFLEKGQVSKNWSITERQSGLGAFNEPIRSAAVEWIKSNVLSGDEHTEKLGCRYTDAFALCYLIVRITSNGVFFTEMEWTKGSQLRFSSDGYEEIKNVFDERDSGVDRPAWAKLNSSFFLDGVSRAFKFVESEANAVIRLWESE